MKRKAGSIVRVKHEDGVPYDRFPAENTEFRAAQVGDE
jgi:hypothetical protein